MRRSLLAILSLLTMFVSSGTVACRQVDAQGKPAPRTQLLTNPGIINAHEHLANDPNSLAMLENVNEEMGVTATALMGSSRHTLRLDGSGFIEHHENNAPLCELARQHPGKYFVFVTFDPIEENIVEKLKAYLNQGATGVKLYLGHGASINEQVAFHRYPLDDPRIMPLYAYCEKERVPILLHTNLRKYEPEFRRVMNRHPTLPIILPHFGLKLGLLDDLTALMRHYPTIYVDISFGWPTYLDEGLERISRLNRQVRAFFDEFQDRIFFGTDVVFTPGKSEAFARDCFRAYRQALEFEAYDFKLQFRQMTYDRRYRGLALPEAILRKVYKDNYLEFLGSLGRL